MRPANLRSSLVPLVVLFFTFACLSETALAQLADPRAAAIELALTQQRAATDIRPSKLRAAVMIGRVCDEPGKNIVANAVAKFKKAGVRVTGPRDETIPAFAGSAAVVESCWRMGWKKDDIVETTSFPSYRGFILIGRYVVEKIGEEQQGAFGTRVVPFRAHFVANNLGSKLISLGLAEKPPAMIEQQAEMHKDVDGRPVAAL